MEARRRKKNANLEKQREMKSEQLQQRINKALKNSEEHQANKN